MDRDNRRRKAEGGEWKASKTPRSSPGTLWVAPRSSRRGVLLLVVLSMLVLFMLIGTAFLMTSSQSRDAAKAAAKKDRLGTHGTHLLDRALMHVLRDTENPAAAPHTHSLLRDLYGTDGFQGVIYSPSNVNANFPPNAPAGQATRYAGAGNLAGQYGQTVGQFIDIYVSSLRYSPGESLDLRHVVKLDRNILGQPQAHTLPLTKGYYNGCLLTVTSGPAAGQSARILDYEHIADLVPATATPPATATRLFRFRVMAFARADGRPLQIGTSDTPPQRVPELVDIAGATFIVNGRPFNGTGVGYNPLAATGTARLTTLEAATVGSDALGLEVALTPNARYFNFSRAVTVNPDPLVPPFGADQFVAGGSVGEPSDNPKPRYLWLNHPSVSPANWPYQTFAGPGDADEGYDAADFQNMWLALMTVTPRAQGRVVHDNGSGAQIYFDPNEPAAFSNLDKFLRLDLEDVPLPSFHRPDLVNFWYHRLHALLVAPPINMDENDAVRAILQPYDADGNLSSWMPSGAQGQQIAALIAGIKRKVMMRPIREDHPRFDGGNTQSQATTLPPNPLVVGNNIAIPYWEAVGPWDVDNDNDGVADSVWVDLGDPVLQLEDGTRVKAMYAYLIIDLDSRLNVNAHGLADHIRPDDLAYVQLPNSAQFDVGPNLAGTDMAKNPAVLYSTNLLAPGLGYGPAEINLRPVFPIPWAAADGTLDYNANRSEKVLATSDWPIDSYATLLIGRERLERGAVSGRYGYGPTATFHPTFMSTGQAISPGQNYLYLPNVSMPTGEQAVPDLAAQIKFFNYPWTIRLSSAFGTPPDLFGRYAVGLDYAGQPVYEVLNDAHPVDNTLPRPLLTDSPYELNLSRSKRGDTWAASFNDSAAEFGQSLVQNDDAPYSPADLERVLRGWDADAGTLPSRLWDVVDAFDPLKLMEFDPYRVEGIADLAFGSTADPELLATAQQITAINRRLVTTDSFDLPVPAGSVPNLAALSVGPDGQPGRAGIDDDPDGAGPLTPNGTPDDVTEIGSLISDDFRTIMLKDPSQATFIDLYRYRVWSEMRRKVMLENSSTELSLQGLNDADYDTFLKVVNYRASLVLGEWFSDANNNLIYDAGEPFLDVDGNGVYTPALEPPHFAREVLAGKRMDLNRPFGDGRDNGDGIDNDGNGLIDDSLLLETDPNLPANPGPDKLLNGVVDDPLEAGEPYLDTDGNGKWNNNEPYIDLDGNGAYTWPRDQLWADLTDPGNGPIKESIAFDYTNGQAVPIHPAVGAVAGGVRNLESQARQLYARHLYCLMLLLVDENYIAPWDENDPQIMTWIETKRKEIETALLAPPYNVPPADAPAQADFIVKRKLTCRTIAQWAINCVDMSDADVIMTPFEYDENPWDGWGCPDPNGVNIPLDGDPATNENKGEVIKWSTDGSKVIAPSAPGVLPAVAAIVTAPTALDQTRGIVWGVERPELLITETLAFHDRRTEDLQSPDSNYGHDDFQNTKNPFGGASQRYKDYDLDQGLRPRGSLFVELYNPWSPDGQYPAELYRDHKGEAHKATDVNDDEIQFEGVMLNRLSNLAADITTTSGKLSTAVSSGTIRRSPVWRVIVVEEWPDMRNRDLADDKPEDARKRLAPGFTKPQAYADLESKWKEWKPTQEEPLPRFRPANPDFTEVFDAGFKISHGGYQGYENSFDVRYPYIEREFYFTTDNSPNRNVNSANFKLRIPDRAIKPDPAFYSLSNHPSFEPPTSVTHWQTQMFIAPRVLYGVDDQPIAPIMPGRYGIVGSAGTRYQSPPSLANSFTTAIGRLPDSDPANPNTPDQPANEPGPNAPEPATPHMPELTRRIELRPATKPFESDPNVNQVLVAGNGGDNPTIAPNWPPDPAATSFERARALRAFNANRIGRSNELIDEKNALKNIMDRDNDKAPDDADQNDDGVLDGGFYKPCVAIPVEGMNISEPPWGWATREWEAAQIEKDRRTAANSNAPQNPTIHGFDPNRAKREGRYFAPADWNLQSYDVPFDTSPELVRTGTTANYRTIHLQRLANPLLPWNPPPGEIKDSAGIDMHRPNLPINPYRTVDTSSVDLTAFNGVSRAEGNYPDPPSGGSGRTTQRERGQFRPWIFPEGFDAPDVPNFGTNMEQAGVQAWQFKSLERGAYSLLSATHRIRNYSPDPNALPWINPLPQRVLPAQEPVVGMIADLNPDPDPAYQQGIKAIRDGRKTTMMGIVTGTDLLTDEKNRVPDAVKTAQDIRENHVNMVLEHSLGFGNESVGALFKRPFGQPQPSTDAPTQSAVGAPRQYQVRDEVDDVNDDLEVNSTYPWLAWNNRPFASAEEIWNVPGASSAQMLRQFSAGSTVNPYDGTTIGNAARWAGFTSPFGHLLNVFLTSNEPAGLTAGATPEFAGAPHFYRILEYVQVPSRYVGTDTMLTAEIFNDVPGVVDGSANSGTFGTDILSPQDPRYNFQPPFNKVSRERDPGKVNLNTVTGRRVPPTATDPPRIWSEVFDGIMHRHRDSNLTDQIAHLGPSWRDVVLSRRGYAQFDAASPPTLVDKPSNPGAPDVFQFGLNNNSPTVFANPFRSPDAGDLVPLQGMVQPGIQASWLRSHPYGPGPDGGWGVARQSPDVVGSDDDELRAFNDPLRLVDDAREAGFGDDVLVPSAESFIPLFSERADPPFVDGNRNPYMYYQPMTRLGNLVTNRSNVFAIWITVGYFEVEPAPNWSNVNVQRRFGGDGAANSQATNAAQALYNRVYPDGYMLGREVGSDTGDIKRARGFYIVDRTEEVGFKPGEDLNVEKMIRLRRRIE